MIYGLGIDEAQNKISKNVQEYKQISQTICENGTDRIKLK